MRLIALALLLALSAASTAQTLIFSHDFENNSLSPAGGGATGGGPGPTTVSTDRANGGTHSAKLRDDYYELLYTLDTAVDSITIQWDMYIPVGYFANRSGSGNDKFIRVYSEKGYGSSEKIGASTQGGGGGPEENFYLEWGAPGGNDSFIGDPGPGTTWQMVDHIVLADEGTWKQFRFYYSPPKAPGQKGSIKFWVNGVLKKDAADLVDNYDPAVDETHNVHEFYIMGHANSPRDPSVYYYIDNVSVWSGLYEGEAGTDITASMALSRAANDSLSASGDVAVSGSSTLASIASSMSASAGVAIAASSAMSRAANDTFSASSVNSTTAKRRRASFRAGFGF